MTVRAGIIVPGDRRNSGFCLGCGTTLLQPWNDYQCCAGCTRNIVKCLEEFERKRKRQKSVGTRPVKSQQIFRQVAPMGEPVK